MFRNQWYRYYIGPRQLYENNTSNAKPSVWEQIHCCILSAGTRYMVVDCGGGTVDITVHELGNDNKLTELYKATGGPYGATGVGLAQGPG